MSKISKQIRFKIKTQSFETIEICDRLMREHNYQAMVLGNELNKLKLQIAVDNDPELKERWLKGYVDIGIDWKTQELVVSPTMDQQLKAKEAGEAIAKLKESQN